MVGKLFKGLEQNAEFHLEAAWNAGGNNDPAAIMIHLEEYLETQIQYFRTRPILDNLSEGESEKFWEYFYSAVNTDAKPSRELIDLASRSGFKLGDWLSIVRDVYRE